MYDASPCRAPGLSNPGFPPAWRRLPEGQRSVPPGPTGTPACQAPQPGLRCPCRDLNGSTARRGAGNSAFVFAPGRAPRIFHPDC